MLLSKYRMKPAPGLPMGLKTNGTRVFRPPYGTDDTTANTWNAYAIEVLNMLIPFLRAWDIKDAVERAKSNVPASHYCVVEYKVHQHEYMLLISPEARFKKQIHQLLGVDVEDDDEVNEYGELEEFNHTN
ncbi:hypothetical protein TruAng_008622 [Truncatella angustata]|nr:hypothetical protein TruAng_008622 [Truncatella angustata]